MKAIKLTLLLILLTSLTFVTAQDITIYKDTQKYGLVKITISKVTALDSLLNNFFTAYFQKSQVYVNEQVDIRDSITYVGGTCKTVAYWEVFIKNPDGSSDGLGDVSDFADNIGGCNYEAWVSFVTNEAGTYGLYSKYQFSGMGNLQATGGNTLEVIDSSGTDCEWQDWSLFKSITNGIVQWKEYKDLDLMDSNDCKDQKSVYQTYCDNGYLVQGTNSRTSSACVTCVFNCVKDTSKSCTQVTQDDTGKIIKNGGSCIGFVNKMKCIDGDLYSCTDFQSNLGSCWYGGFASSPKSGCASCSTFNDQTSCEKLVGCSWKSAASSSTGQAYCFDSSGFNECTSGQDQCPDGVCVVHGAGCCNHGTDCNTGGTTNTNGKTITLSEYYSISDDEFSDYAYGCGKDLDCTTLTGYNVKCVKDGTLYNQMQKRVYSYYEKQCSETIPSSIKILLGISNWLFNLGDAKNVCSNFAQVKGSVLNFWNKFFKSGTGFCVAKSNTWYGGLWEQALTMIGGLGIPTQYVLIATAGILLLVFIIILNLFKGRR